jgi:DeoR/GlpR family transcriptional regulator of sugar metabolism
MAQRSEPRQALPEPLTLSSSERRIIIMDTVRQKREINVRDVAEKIRGVSEKTIQRELLAMVAEGILAKKGEKRWSTYSISGAGK